MTYELLIKSIDPRMRFGFSEQMVYVQRLWMASMVATIMVYLYITSHGVDKVIEQRQFMLYWHREVPKTGKTWSI